MFSLLSWKYHLLKCLLSLIPFSERPSDLGKAWHFIQYLRKLGIRHPSFSFPTFLFWALWVLTESHLQLTLEIQTLVMARVKALFSPSVMNLSLPADSSCVLEGRRLDLYVISGTEATTGPCHLALGTGPQLPQHTFYSCAEEMWFLLRKRTSEMGFLTRILTSYPDTSLS